MSGPWSQDCALLRRGDSAVDLEHRGRTDLGENRLDIVSIVVYDI